MKPHIRLAYLLILFGMGLLALERYGLGALKSEHVHVGQFAFGALALAPLLLIFSGALVFLVGGRRR